MIGKQGANLKAVELRYTSQRKVDSINLKRYINHVRTIFMDNDSNQTELDPRWAFYESGITSRWPLMFYTPERGPIYLKECVSYPKAGETPFLEAKNLKETENNAIYIHIPFCDSICAFCNYNRGVKNELLVEDYLKALKSEITLYAKTPYIKSSRFIALYLGGGTPSSLSAQQLVELIQLCKTRFNILPDAEITIEGSPSSFDDEKLKALRKTGANRISLGVQTFDGTISKYLDLPQDPIFAAHRIEAVHNAGYDNLDIDLIYGLPGQSIEILRDTLKKAIDLKVEHISWYPLRLYAGTKLFKKLSSEEIPSCANREMLIKLRREAFKIFLQAGYGQRALDQFSLPNKYRKYKELAPFGCFNILGLGLGANGYVNRFMYKNDGSLDGYIDKLKISGFPVQAGAEVSREEEMRLFIIQGMRGMGRLDKHRFFSLYGQNPENIFPDIFNSLAEKKLLETNEAEIKLTDSGKAFSGHVSIEFFPEKDREQLDAIIKLWKERKADKDSPRPA